MAKIEGQGGLSGWAVPDAGAGDLALDQAFDEDTLAELRAAVLAQAVAAGIPDDRAALVVLAVHELAANVVRHGGGAGRARMRMAAGELHCQVSDVGLGSVDGDTRTGGAAVPTPWPVRRRRGLWLVYKVADRVSVVAGYGGSEVTTVFALPGFAGRATGQ
jgi:anti-sigma regulatory factor (Ser/Thr protein kinase)